MDKKSCNKLWKTIVSTVLLFSIVCGTMVFAGETGSTTESLEIINETLEILETEDQESTETSEGSSVSEKLQPTEQTEENLSPKISTFGTITTYAALATYSIIGIDLDTLITANVDDSGTGWGWDNTAKILTFDNNANNKEFTLNGGSKDFPLDCEVVVNISAGNNTTINLNGLHVDTSGRSSAYGKAAFLISNGNVTLNLVDGSENTFKSYGGGSGNVESVFMLSSICDIPLS